MVLRATAPHLNLLEFCSIYTTRNNLSVDQILPFGAPQPSGPLDSLYFCLACLLANKYYFIISS